MNKVTGVLLGLFLSLAVVVAANANNIEISDMIDYWSLDRTQYGENQEPGQWFDSVWIEQNHPLTYTHDVNDSIDLEYYQIVDATLELDFTNDCGDSHYFGFFKFDNREFASYVLDSNTNSWVSLGEVDNGQYDILLDVDWLNDDGKLDVTLNVTNSLETATAWLDHSKLTGTAISTVPEPTTMLLFGAGLLGLAGASRKKQGKING